MNKRNYIGTVTFFILGTLIGGLAPIIAIYREYAQYKESGVLEYDDIKRYVTSSGLGAIVNTVIATIIL